MSRPRAGLGRRLEWRRDRPHWSVFGTKSGWVPSGEAKGWPRCARCRRPAEELVPESDDLLCPICYFYHALPKGDFWPLYEAGHRLHPYRIGERSMGRSA
jgi:hypothetical protein